eukprot:CAMPEP_0113696940 /NCGR_PEP_ID=MMETSP0038_2-20120614/21832_1 /TAXON_ID=2898 /ORGANISM="Cryptomonas paramecium" /LENGTH=78 /DNA_ID=CAMNT_0000619845 /DNA_START=337 /DNA_END=571 /DNA_ORIENTATION=- /assembly_acc=CAM_ASM_000170
MKRRSPSIHGDLSLEVCRCMWKLWPSGPVVDLVGRTAELPDPSAAILRVSDPSNVGMSRAARAKPEICLPSQVAGTIP